MGEKKDPNIYSTNIFDDFGTDDKLKEEIDGMEKQKQKDLYYYFGVINNFFTFINTFTFISFIILGGYIFIQNNKEMKDMGYLNSVCNIFVDDLGKEITDCGSVSSLIDYYEIKNDELIKKYYNENLSLIKDIYKNSNFIFSNDVLFLIEKSNTRLKVLDILSEFDKLKNYFEPLNKSRIKCSNIKLSSDFILDMKCSAYSGNWDTKILGYSGENTGQDKTNGTSISIANSFINYIEKIKEPKFFILDKQKKFSFIEIVDDNGYTKKTDFNLKLRYKNNNILLQKK